MSSSPPSKSSAQVVRFAVFEANLRSGELRKSGVRVKLHDQPFQILAMLLEHSGELVTREEIQKRLWPGETFVDFDHGLNNAVNRLRDALGDSADAPKFIETLPRRGYRFIGGTNVATIGAQSNEPLEITQERNAGNGQAVKGTGGLHRWSLIAGCLIGLVTIFLIVQSRHTTIPSSRRLFVLPPAGAIFNLIGDEGGSVALSPDGARLAFVAGNSRGESLIWVRSLGKLAPDAIEGTDGGTFPFWSPDGKSIGFFSNGKLKRVGSDGTTPPKTICEAAFGRGGSWNSNGVIIFAPESHSSIYRVPDSGGTPIPVTSVDPSLHTSHRWPRYLPDGKHFIYLAVSHFNSANQNGIYLSSLDGRENKRIVSTDAEATYASGYLFFLRKDEFVAQPFDVERGQLKGEARQTPEKVLYDPTIWKAVFDVSDHGVMAYQLGDRVRGNQFRWFDRGGNERGVLGEPSFQFEPKFSPDGRKLAVGIADGGYSHLWLYDLARNTRMQITFSKYDNGSPVWSPDSTHILFTAKRQHYSLYEVDASGAEPENLILDTGRDTWPLSLSPDGRFLLYCDGIRIGGTRSRIWVYSMNGKRPVFRLLSGEALERDAQFSPDGRWIAYTSNESGRVEVYVVPFVVPPRSGQVESAALRGKWQLSRAGGHTPRWRRNGTELFYLAPDNSVMAVPISTRGPNFDVREARILFHANPGLYGFSYNPGFYGPSYDVSPDGSKFIVNAAPVERTAPITVVEGWLSDLKK